MAEKTCFVISPLSEKGTAVRKEADDLLWVINQALAKYAFKVVRIDEIAKSHEITREIIRFVRESELCIIILTGSNPNVFYEAGRRHEAGRPFIHLLKDGERLPFDVAGINTIHYGDITTLDGAKELTAAIERFVTNMRTEIEGQPGSRQATLEAVAEMLVRLDGKVSRLGLKPSHFGLGASPGLDDARAAMRNPREAFMLAIAQGDIDTATALLSRLETLLGRSEEFHKATLMCTLGGSMAASEIAKGFLSSQPDWFKESDVIETVGVLVSYYSLTDREEEGMAVLAPMIDSELEKQALSAEQRAQFLNQKQRLLFGMKRFDEAIVLAEEVLQLEPDRPSFYHNASMIYEALKRYDKAAEMADRLLALDEKDDDHLAQAVDVYVADNQVDKAKHAFQLLKDMNPRKAALKMLDERVRAALGGT